MFKELSCIHSQNLFLQNTELNEKIVNVTHLPMKLVLMGYDTGH